MILFIKDNCSFCDRIKTENNDLQIAKVVITTEGLMVEIAGERIMPPVHLQGVPALLIGNRLLYGLTLIQEELKSKGLLKDEVTV